MVLCMVDVLWRHWKRQTTVRGQNIRLYTRGTSTFLFELSTFLGSFCALFRKFSRLLRHFPHLFCFFHVFLAFCGKFVGNCFIRCCAFLIFCISQFSSFSTLLWHFCRLFRHGLHLFGIFPPHSFGIIHTFSLFGKVFGNFQFLWRVFHTVRQFSTLLWQSFHTFLAFLHTWEFYHISWHVSHTFLYLSHVLAFLASCLAVFSTLGGSFHAVSYSSTHFVSL